MTEEDDSRAFTTRLTSRIRSSPRLIWALFGALATIGGVIGLLLLFGVHIPFISGSANDQRISEVQQEIDKLKDKVERLPEYLADLDETEKETLRDAYEEGRLLQCQAYAAQDQGKHLEAIDRFTGALVLAENDAQRAALHMLRGNSFLSTGVYGSAEEDYNQALALAERLPDPDAQKARAGALGNLGLVFQEQGDLDQALSHHRQALDIDREIGDRLGEAQDLGNLGLVFQEQGDLDQARSLHQQALEIHREIGNRLGEARQLGNLGIVYKEQGDFDRAREHHQQALDTDREIGNRLGEANHLGNLGLVYQHQGDLEEARSYHHQALDIDREIGYRRGEAQDLGNLGNVYYLEGDLEEARSHYEQALAIAREIGYRRGEAIRLGSLGLVAVKLGERAEACRLLKESASIFEEIGAGGPNVDIARSKLQELGCE